MIDDSGRHWVWEYRCHECPGVYQYEQRPHDPMIKPWTCPNRGASHYHAEAKPV